MLKSCASSFVEPMFALEYSPTRRSKKFVLPCKDIKFIKSKGQAVFQYFSNPRETSNLSPQNDTYSFISSSFIPISRTGRLSEQNICSISTASFTILRTRSLDGGRSSFENNRLAKSQCNPSSRLISSLLKVKPGMSPRFFNQKMLAKELLKNIPSQHANATSRSPKG